VLSCPVPHADALLKTAYPAREKTAAFGYSFGAPIAHAVATALQDAGILEQLGEPGSAAVTEVAATNARLAPEFTPGTHHGELFYCVGPESDPTPRKSRVDGGVECHTLPFGHVEMAGPAALAEVSAGRTVAHGPAGRTECLDHVERTWIGLGRRRSCGRLVTEKFRAAS